MPVIAGAVWPKIPLPPKERDQTDIPMCTRDYRFSGYRLERDDQGNIIRIMPEGICQPSIWTRRSASPMIYSLR